MDGTVTKERLSFPTPLATSCRMRDAPGTIDLADGLPVPQRYWAVLASGLAVLMAVLDGAIANVALPSIAQDLNVSPASSIWVVNAYQLAVTISLLPMASLGEIYGYQKIYRFGLALFTVASLLCALSDSLLTLTLARIIQGFGASGILAVNTAMVRTIYPRAMLGRGIGFNAMIVAFSSAAGPTIAAGILSAASWPWLFAVNLPIGVLALTIGAFTLPASPPNPRAFDWPSAGLNALTFGLLVFSVDGVAHGEGHLAIGLELAGAVGFGVVLVLRQLARPAPLLPIDLLRIPLFALSALTSLCSFTGFTLAYLSMPFYFQMVLHLSEVATGLLMTPWPLTLLLIAPVAGRLADRYPVGVLSTIGLVVFALGLTSLALLPSAPSNLDLMWRMSLSGAGFALFQSPNNRAMVTAAPRVRSGAAAGLLSTCRTLGQTMGAALVALMFTLRPDDNTHAALELSVCVAVFAAVISCTRLSKK